MTTAKSALDDYKLQFEDIAQKKHRIIYRHNKALTPTHKLKKMRFNLVKGYLEVWCERILK